METDENNLDPCSISFDQDAIPDDDIDGIVLFADVAGDEKAIAERKALYEEIFE